MLLTNMPASAMVSLLVISDVILICANFSAIVSSYCFSHKVFNEIATCSVSLSPKWMLNAFWQSYA